MKERKGEGEGQGDVVGTLCLDESTQSVVY